MTSQLRNMMAEIESWESATEFGIPEELWAEYQVKRRSDDLYIAVLSALFDILRAEISEDGKKQLSELAKTLLIYSRSAASRYLAGVERNLNLLYCASTFYLAGFPATAHLVAEHINHFDSFLEEEKFLRGLLSRRLNDNNELDQMALEDLKYAEETNFQTLLDHFKDREQEGLNSEPRLFIASRLAKRCLERFKYFNVWDCLRKNAANYTHEVWEPFLVNSKTFPLWELFPSQMAAIESGILGDQNEVYSLQMPTSAGKTSLCEILIFHEVKAREKRVLFLVPFRALASEIKEGVSKRLEAAGVSVLASHGGNIPTRSETANVETADVLIITPEKFIALTQSMPELESAFDTVICDEGHLIDDSSRGLQYELLLTKLKGTENQSRKIIFISAILPNVDDIHKWLGGTVETLAQSDYKPVETDFAFIAPQETDAWQLDFNTIYKRPRSYFLRSFLIQDDFRFRNPETGRFKLISGYKTYASLACAAALKARRNGPVALFTTQKGNNGVAGLSNKMIELCTRGAKVSETKSQTSEKLPDLIEYIRFQFGKEFPLSKLLEYGIGFHHGSLPQEIRREMEMAIQNGSINILICTSTLAEGVNLPIRTLVIHTVKRFNSATEQTLPIERRSIKNIVGRVGRAGKETRGRIIFANNDERDFAEEVFRDIQLEPAKGTLSRIIKNLNRIVREKNIQLSNDIFERQNPAFLSILDKIDATLIDLLPLDIVSEDIEESIGHLLERTLAYQYCDTDELKSRIKEVFVLRAQHLEKTVPREQWNSLKKSGSSPRLWQFFSESKLLDRPEWISLDDPYSQNWIEEVVLKLIDMKTIEIKHDKEYLSKAILGWIKGLSYQEIATSCNLGVDDTLEVLGHDIGYALQDILAKLSQLAIEKYGDEDISEISRNWVSLLQYGLGDMQQLDMFERGSSDRLGVWGISRYLQTNDISERGRDLVFHLRDNSENVVGFLRSDPRVPNLSIKRICEELRIRA